MLNSEQLGNLSDRDLLAQSRAYEAKITADAASLNFTNLEGDAIKNFNNSFESSLDQWGAVQIQEAGISQAKVDGRKALLAELRRQRNVAYADKSVSESALAAAGMPPRDTTKTPTPAPKTAPIGYVDYGKLKHVISFRDSATPDKKAKPAGMLGCEIWRFIGTAPPTAESDYQYVATDTDSPYVSMFQMADAGKKVYYQLRWLSKSGERGGWSETIEATING
ncbi:hypothetical protein BH10ACI1_BH10ACI1_27160 [soil metagenome]